MCCLNCVLSGEWTHNVMLNWTDYAGLYNKPSLCIQDVVDENNYHPSITGILVVYLIRSYCV